MNSQSEIMGAAGIWQRQMPESTGRFHNHRNLCCSPLWAVRALGHLINQIPAAPVKSLRDFT